MKLASGQGRAAAGHPLRRSRPLRRTPIPEWLRIDWREHRGEVDVVGARANYVEMGEGPPLLFIHGLSGAWQNWLENIPHFARDHRVVALDLPGFGASPMPPWEISIPAYGRFLRDFCERIGIDRCSLVGNSMGGFIATEVAITEPERVDDLTLISAAGITWARRPARARGGDRADRAGPAHRSSSSSTWPGSGAARMRKALLPGRLLRPRQPPAGGALGELRPGAAEPRATTTR